MRNEQAEATSKAESLAEAERERRREDAREDRLEAIAKAEAEQAEAQRAVDAAYRRRNFADAALRDLHAEHSHLRADAVAGVKRLAEAAWGLARGEAGALARELARGEALGGELVSERLLRVIGLILASGRTDVHEGLRDLVASAPTGRVGVSDLTAEERETARDRLREERAKAERERQEATERQARASRALTAATYGEAGR